MVVYLDNVLVTGGSWQERLTRLATVLEKLRLSGLHFRKDKCEFMTSAVTYLGYTIDSEKFTLKRKFKPYSKHTDIKDLLN